MVHSAFFANLHASDDDALKQAARSLFEADAHREVGLSFEDAQLRLGVVHAMAAGAPRSTEMEDVALCGLLVAVRAGRRPTTHGIVQATGEWFGRMCATQPTQRDLGRARKFVALSLFVLEATDYQSCWE